MCMAKYRNRVSAQNMKIPEYTVHHFVYFLDCCKALLDNDAKGELPLIKELFALQYPYPVKTSPACGFARGFVAPHQSAKVETASLAKEYFLRGFVAPHQSAKVETSSLAKEYFLRDRRHNLDEDEFSLQHWMQSGCFPDNVSKIRHRDHTLAAEPSSSGTAEDIRRATRVASPSSGDDVESTPGAFRKSLWTKKRFRSRKANKQSHRFLFASVPNSYNNNNPPFAPNCLSPPLTDGRPLVVRQGLTKKRKQSERQRKNNHLNGFGQISAGRSGAGKEAKRCPTSMSFCNHVPLLCKGAKQSSLDDGWTISKWPGSLCTEPYQRSTSKNQRTVTISDNTTSRFTRDHSEKVASSERLPVETGFGLMQPRVNGQDNSQQEVKRAVSVQRAQTLSQKYRPKVLKDLIGQDLVTQALSNTILNGNVAPLYLFQGPSGTGKTSAARIFAAALHCINSGDQKPCGLCSECLDFASGKASGLWELDAASHKGITCFKEVLQGILSSNSGPRYKVIILDECHMFPNEKWSLILDLLEAPLVNNAVIILITTHPGELPFPVVSRCQKLHFLPIQHSDIIDHLDAILKSENLDAETGALSLIASRSQGSLRDAENVVDQASLLEQRITLDSIHRMVSSVSDDKLLSLLDVALRADALCTVQRTRDIIDSGVEPLDLMSQLASLITSILNGSYLAMNTNGDRSRISALALSALEMERLQTALTILSEAESQLKETSQYRTTWLMAALLHVAPRLQSKSRASPSSMTLTAIAATQNTMEALKKKVPNVRKGQWKRVVLRGEAFERESHKSDTFEEKELTQVGLQSWVHSVNHSCLQRKPRLAAHVPSYQNRLDLDLKTPSSLERIWANVLKYCRPLSLKQLLQDHGRLLAVSFSGDKVVAHLKFEKQDPKFKAEFYEACIVNSFRKVLGCSVEVEISMSPAVHRAGSLCSSTADYDESVLQSTSKQSLRIGSEFPCASSCFNSTPISSQLPTTNFMSDSKEHFCMREAVIAEEHCSKRDLINVEKGQIQTTIACCPQSREATHKLRIETLKDRKQLGRILRKPTNASRCDSTQIHEKRKLVLEPQLKCGGFLCLK